MKTRIIETVDANEKQVWQVWKDEPKKTDRQIQETGECLGTGFYSITEAQVFQKGLTQ